MNNLDLIDVLTILSFVLQVQNQDSIIDMSDIQQEINMAVNDIHKHLNIQDKKIDMILEVLDHNED